jgi:DNA-binding transcriptional LysR family regulator
VSLRTSIIGAPAFFERHGRPEQPEDLASLPAIVFTQLPQPQDWRLRHPDEGERLVRVEAAYRFNNAAAVIPTLTAGLAVAAQPEIFVRRELASGVLETVLPTGPWLPSHPRPDAPGQDAAGAGAGADRVSTPAPGRRGPDCGAGDLIVERLVWFQEQ